MSIGVYKHKPMSEETKLKISKIHKGRAISEKQKNQISQSLKGRKLTDETKNRIRVARIGKEIPTTIRNKISVSLIGHKMSSATRLKISESKKGRAVSEATKLKISKPNSTNYRTIHLWVSREFGQKMKCDHCKTTSSKKYHWSNKDHLYRRDINDWMRLCVSCHRRYDREHNKK